MKTPAETIAAWNDEPGSSRDVLYRALVEFDSWMPPLRDDFEGDAFAPFELAMVPLVTIDGAQAIPLCSCWDATEAWRDQHGPTGFGDRGGWEMFAAFANADAVVIDPGMPHALTLTREDLPQLKALAEAVAVERAWQRLRKGREEPGDLALAAHYGSYHLGVAKRDAENFCFCEVPNDDGRMFIAVFTHGDALERGWPEIAGRYANMDARKARVSGPEIFPTLAAEPTAGFVVNCSGPTESAVFSREAFDLVVQELNKAAPPASDTPAASPAAQARPEFDRLSAASDAAGATITDHDALYSAAFRLNEWYFVARGEMPDVRPYVASNAGIANGAPMVKAFTDTARLRAFAKECGLTRPNGDVDILSMPVANILPTMAAYAASGATYIHFNANVESYGFYIPLVQLPIIRRHLEKQGLL